MLPTALLHTAINYIIFHYIVGAHGVIIYVYYLYQDQLGYMIICIWQ